MAGLVLTSVTRSVPRQVVHDDDQLVSEKIAAYWDFVSRCAHRDMAPMSEPDITMDTDFYGQTTITVTGWAFHSAPLAPVCTFPDPDQPTLFDLLAVDQTSRRVG